MTKPRLVRVSVINDEIREMISDVKVESGLPKHEIKNIIDVLVCVRKNLTSGASDEVYGSR